MNKVFLIGNLTRDPELSENSNGTPLCRFGIAVNRKAPSGDKVADFYNVTAFRGLALTVSKFCRKGDKVAVCGDIQLRTYEGNDGVKRTVVDVIVQDIEFLGQRERPEERNSPAKKPAVATPDDFDDGDIPF